jgi:hypothetical protein
MLATRRVAKYHSRVGILSVNVHYMYRDVTGRWALRAIFAVYVLRARTPPKTY